MEAKTEELNTLKEDIRSMKEGMEDINKMKKHFARIQEEEAQKKNLKEKILAEIAEEEKCCLVIGFPFTSMKKGEILDGLIPAIMKEGICPDDIRVVKKQSCIEWEVRKYYWSL